MCVSADDVAAYILKKCGAMTTMKLQKLVYYCQAWSLVWDEKPLFKDKIEAWAGGPVIKTLYNKHKGQFSVNKWPSGNIAKLNQEQKETIQGVIAYYGDKKAQWLSDLAHMEDPWKDARKKAGLKNGDRGCGIISTASMHEYYSGINDGEQ